MNRIAIIGAGLSGKLLAFNLLRQASGEVKIIQVDCNDPGLMGPAYSDEADYLLLNVLAGRMGAIPEDEEHFLKWAQARGIRAGKLDFLPRKLYREYILELLAVAQKMKTSKVSFEQVRGEVTDLEVRQGKITFTLDGRLFSTVVRAVLALGNFPPRHPKIKNLKALSSERYIQNPWRPGLLDSLKSSDTVFLIGTGQMAVDLAIGLYRRGHTGRIVTLSRRGLMPLAHRCFDQYPSFYEEIKDSKRILAIFRVVRKHLVQAEVLGIDRRAVIDSLRPFSAAIWQNLLERRSAGSYGIFSGIGRSSAAGSHRKAKSLSGDYWIPGNWRYVQEKFST